MKKIYVCGYCGHSDKPPFEVCPNCGKDYTGSEWITGNPKPRRKELLTEIEILEAVVAAKENTITELRRDFDANQESLYFNTKVEIDGLKSQLDEKGAEVVQLKAEIDAMQHAYFLYEEPQPDGNLRTPIGKVLAEKDAEIEQLKAQYNAEVDQYNAGYEAGENGGLDPFDDQPHYEPDYDVWRGGYRDASYDRLKAELTAKQAIIDELTAELDEALATCTDLAVAGAASDLFRLYDWGEE